MLETGGVGFKKYRGRVERAAKACLLFLLTSDKTKKSKNTPSESRGRWGTTRGNLKNIDVDIYLVSDEEMRAINKRFRGKDKATNVLSFREPKGFPHPERKKRILLGEVYLAPAYIENKGENIEALVIHGVLHLAGYTHDKVRDRMEMEKKEKEILKICQKSSPVSTSAPRK